MGLRWRSTAKRVRQGRVARRAFTLIEILISLVIVGAVVGLVMPELVSRLATGTLEEGARRAEEAFALARTDAILEGRAIAVRARRTGGQMVLESVTVSAAGTGDEEGDLDRDHDVPVGAAIVSLPNGVWMDVSAELGPGDPDGPEAAGWMEGDDTAASVGGAAGAMPGSDARSGTEPIALVTFFPDGTSTGCRVRVTDGSRSIVIGVSALLGSVSVERVATGVTEEPEGEHEDEPAWTSGDSWPEANPGSAP